MISRLYVLNVKWKLINDDEHIKNDFGYNRLNIRYRNCVKCKKYNTERVLNMRAEIHEDFKKQIEIYGDYIPDRNKIRLNPNEKYRMWCMW